MSEEEIIKRINILIMQLVHERKENIASIEQIKIQEAIQRIIRPIPKGKRKERKIRDD